MVTKRDLDKYCRHVDFRHDTALLWKKLDHDGDDFFVLEELATAAAIGVGV